MEWYHLFSPLTEKIIALTILAIAFALILYRKINITYISLVGAALLIATGIIAPDAALWDGVEWKVLTIYWGYGMLAFAFRECRLPAWLGILILKHVKKEKYVLLLLCTLAAVLSSFMANPVVVIILAPLFIDIADKLKSNLFVYLVGLAIASNVVTTVTMVADPPALIVAARTGMQFLDFYWFQGKVGLGTITIFGVIAAMLVLLYQFRTMNNSVEGIEEETVEIKSHIPLIIFVVSVVALSLPIMTAGIPLVNQRTVGFLVGVGFGMLVGCGIGGNIAPVGATANVLACGMLEKRGYKIELGKYLALSVPFSVAPVIVAHIMLQLIWL